MRKSVVLIFALSLFPVVAVAAVKLEAVEYKQGDTELSGWVAYDDAAKGPRPGVLLVHDWFGATDHQKAQIEKLAALGYVAMAADIYGKGVRPANAGEAGA